MVIKIKGKAAKMLKGGNALDIKTKNRVIYNNGNFKKMIERMRFLFLCNNADFKISTVSKKFIIDHTDPVRNPIPQSGLPVKISTSTTAIVRITVAFTGIFKDISIVMGYLQIFLPV